MIELSLDSRYDWGFAIIDPEELKAGVKKVYLRGGSDDELSDNTKKITGYKDAFGFVEGYIEQMISHESTHFAIFDVFKDENLSKAISMTRKLDHFDGFYQKPTGLTELDPINFAVCDER